MSKSEFPQDQFEQELREAYARGGIPIDVLNAEIRDVMTLAPLTPPVLRPPVIAFVFPGKHDWIISRHEMMQPDGCDDGDLDDLIDAPDEPGDAHAEVGETAS